jgi:hypothetical protein
MNHSSLHWAIPDTLDVQIIEQKKSKKNSLKLNRLKWGGNPLDHLWDFA